MPRRKRSSKLRSDGEVVEMFLLNTGYGATLLTAQPTFDSTEEAAAAWELCRTAAWNLPYRHRSKPPVAARFHDRITAQAVDLLTHGATAEEVHEAAVADMASVEAFRRARPAAAAAIGEHLDAYLDAVRTAASIAEMPESERRDSALSRFQTVGVG